MITDTDIAEFQDLYQKQFGGVLDKDEAFKKLTLLIRQVEIVYQPITKEQYQQYVNEHGDNCESERPEQTS